MLMSHAAMDDSHLIRSQLASYYRLKHQVPGYKAM